MNRLFESQRGDRKFRAEDARIARFERLDGYLFVPPGDEKKILGDELEVIILDFISWRFVLLRGSLLGREIRTIHEKSHERTPTRSQQCQMTNSRMKFVE